MIALLLLVGCAHRGEALDPALPEPHETVAREEPRTVLEAASSSDDPGTRSRALQLLILSSAEAGGGTWGPRGLGDPDTWVQRHAVEALAARLPDAGAVTLLHGYALRTDGLVDPYQRAMAALALAHAGLADAALKQAMSDGWRAERAGWRRAPLALAAAVMGDADAVAPLSETVANGDLPLETEFVASLGGSGLTGLLPALRQGAAAVEEELQLPYAVAQIALGDPSGEGALRKALADPDEEKRLEALDNLVTLDDPLTTGLLERASHDDSDLVRVYAQMALAARGRGAPEQFERAIGSLDRDTRALAVRFALEAAKEPVGGAGKRAVKVARKVVVAALTDEDPTVRIAALEGASQLRLGEPETVAAGLTDEVLDVRVEAAGTLLLLARNP